MNEPSTQTTTDTRVLHDEYLLWNPGHGYDEPRPDHGYVVEYRPAVEDQGEDHWFSSYTAARHYLQGLADDAGREVYLGGVVLTLENCQPSSARIVSLGLIPEADLEIMFAEALERARTYTPQQRVLWAVQKAIGVEDQPESIARTPFWLTENLPLAIAKASHAAAILILGRPLGVCDQVQPADDTVEAYWAAIRQHEAEYREWLAVAERWRTKLEKLVDPARFGHVLN
jgi:hypothetical protein